MSSQSSEEITQSHAARHWPKATSPITQATVQRQMEAGLRRVEAGRSGTLWSSDNPSLQAADVLRTAGISLLLFGGKRLDAVVC